MKKLGQNKETYVSQVLSRSNTGPQNLLNLADCFSSKIFHYMVVNKGPFQLLSAVSYSLYILGSNRYMYMKLSLKH